MKKIGILTFHKSINYGSVLQTWALYNLLTNAGYDVEIIDYEPMMYKKKYTVLRKPNSMENIKANIAVIPILNKVYRQYKYFQIFREKYLRLSNYTLHYGDENSENLNTYDYIICGSDQVWNVRATDCDPMFFLPAPLRGKKIAYAVSINSTDFTEEKYKDNLKSWIMDFSFLSVREQSGAAKLMRYIDNQKNVYTVLDPTLLLTKESFDTICSHRLIRDDYIFLYNIWTKREGLEIAKYLSEKLELPVYMIMPNNSYINIIRLKAEGINVDTINTAPGDYLSYIKNAKFVVSDSFHGTAFSLIFERQFLCVNALNKDGSLRNDERIVGILKQVNLLNRYISIKQLEDCEFRNQIDYSKVTPRRLSTANESVRLLMSELGEIQCK